MTFQRPYALFSLLLLLIEIFIAFCVRDKIIRPYGGDFLVVMLIYCFIKTFFDIPALRLGIGVLAFAFIVEFSQYLNLIHHLNLQDSRIALLLIGKSFQWADMVAYTLGTCVVLLMEIILHRRRVSRRGHGGIQCD